MQKKQNMASPTKKCCLFHHIKEFNNIKLSYIFHLDKNSASRLETLLDFFLSGKSTLGLILVVDKNSFVLKKLIFLRELPALFHQRGKPFGIWGLPYCVIQYIMGGYIYSRYANTLITEPPISIFAHRSWIDSSLLLRCRKCVAVEQCSGVGNLAVNQSTFAWRIQNSERLKNSGSVVLGNETKRHYLVFLKHIRSFSLKKTDRSIKFSTLFKPGGKVPFRDRFIYYCNYLATGEFDAEKKFVLSVSENREYVCQFFQYHLHYFKRYAFSLSSRVKRRETFYGFFVDRQASIAFLDHIGLQVAQESFEEQFHFFGIDFSEQIISGYKLYSKVHNEAHLFGYLREMFFFDIPKALREITYDYLLVRRFDNIGRLKSIKIEFLCCDFPRLIQLTEHHFAIGLDLEKYRKIERIAFDIGLDGNLNKITTYYLV